MAAATSIPEEVPEYLEFELRIPQDYCHTCISLC